jgi:hypothetical protein
MANFVSDPFPTEGLTGLFRRADVELHGVDQAVPSYEGRIFFNNPEANARTALDDSQGYLGSFFVFGKVECWGEEGHCDDVGDRKFDHRRNPTRYAKTRVTVPRDRLARLVQDADGEATLSIVVVMPPLQRYESFDRAEILSFRRLSLVTYR